MRNSFNFPGKVSTDNYSERDFEDFENILVIHSDSALVNGSIENLKLIIEQQNIDFYNTSILENPNSITEDRFLFNDKNYDALIVIGGGTQIDIAKIVLAKLILGKKWSEAIKLGSGMALKRATKFIVLCTLPGSGAESSKAAVLNSLSGKNIFTSNFFLPDNIFYDTKSIEKVDSFNLLLRLIDSFSHSYDAKNTLLANEFSSAYSEYLENNSLSLFEDFYKIRNNQLTSKQIRFLCVNSFYGGLSQSETGSGFGHALAHTLESEFGTIHAESVFLSLLVKAEYMQDEALLKKLSAVYKNLFGLDNVKKHKEILKKLNIKDFLDRSRKDPCWKLERSKIDVGQITQILEKKVEEGKWNI